MKYSYSLAMITAVVLPVSSSNAAAQECRTAALPDGTPAMFCKDKKGNWKQQAGNVEAAPVASVPAAAFLKAEGKYQGTYEFIFKIAPRNQRRRGLNDLISGALNDALNTQTKREPGGISITLNFDGPSVTAQLSGSTIVYKKLVGLVQNGNCVLTNPGGEGLGSVRYEGQCGARGFSGRISGITNRNEPYTGTFQTTALSFTDNSQKEGERAALQKQCDAGQSSACVALDQLK